MKKVIYLLVIVTLGLFFASCTEDTSNQFIVGLECNYAPFNWTESSKSVHNYPISNHKGKYADGYDVQIAKMVAEGLGKKLVIKKLEWDALIPSLESGKIDAIIAGMSPTEERKESVLFTDSYYRSSHVILVKSDSTFINAKGLNDFNGAKIVGQHGTIYDDLIPQLVGAIHQTPLKTVPDILANILANKSDGTVLEKPVAIGVVRANPEFSFIELDEGFVVEEEEVVVSVAVRLEEGELSRLINTILATILEETRIELMEEAVSRQE